LFGETCSNWWEDHKVTIMKDISCV